jgi:hypothetical protein
MRDHQVERHRYWRRNKRRRVDHKIVTRVVMGVDSRLVGVDSRLVGRDSRLVGGGSRGWRWRTMRR